MTERNEGERREAGVTWSLGVTWSEKQKFHLGAQITFWAGSRKMHVTNQTRLVYLYSFFEDLHKIIFKCGLQTHFRHLVLKTYNLEF